MRSRAPLKLPSRACASVFGAAVLLALGSPGCGDDDAPASPPVEVRTAEAVVRVTLEPFALAIENAAGATLLRTVVAPENEPTAYGSPGATRDNGLDNVAILPGWDAFVPDELPWSHPSRAVLISRTETSAAFELPSSEGRAVRLEVAVVGAKVTLRTVSADPRGAPGAAGAEGAWNKTTLAFALPGDEHFFGLGERFASVDHRGLSLYSWAEEGGLGGGEGRPRDAMNPHPNGPSMTYFPVPFFHSSAGYAMHLATTYRTEVHFGSERPDAWRVAVNAVALDLVVYVHDDPLASLDDFTSDTGRPMIPAPWVFGPRRRVSSFQQVDGIAEYQALRQRGVPTTGLDDNVHFLPNRSELGKEDELRRWVDGVHALGFKVMAYNTPYVSTTLPAAREDLERGKQADLFAKTADGALAETFFISGEPQSLATIDLTRPAAVAWFQDMLRRTLALGYDGWMHDFGEYVRRTWRFGDGRNGEAVHNEFPVLSAKAAHDLLQQERPGDFLFFVRSGYTGTQQYVPAVWSGDPEATFDETQGIPAMLRGGLDLGMSGVPLWGSDVTGFKCITDFPNDKEMYLRWAELGAVSPIMMEQNACANPLGRRQKWRLWDDQETVDVYGAMARLHTRLAPYFELLARDAHATGVPIMRHPFLLHPRVPEAWAEESSFYLGPSLYASPVVRRGAVTKDMWLPPGLWVDLADQAVLEGGRRVTVAAPLARLPLLLRDGGIVPLLDPSIETLAPATDPTVVTRARVDDVLDVLVALSPGASGRLVLADGTELSASRTATGAGAPPSGLPEVAPGDVSTCPSGCFSSVAEGSVSRLRLTTAAAAASVTTHEGVELRVSGPRPRRVRWDVLRPR